MGIIIGPLPFKGSVGNLVAYERNGKVVVQTKGGCSKAKFKNAKSMQRTRENASEWTGVVSLGKALRHGVPFLQNAGDSTLHGRLQGFLRGLIHEDTVNKRGERLVPASALAELRHFSSVKGGAVMDNYLSDVKITDVPEGVKFEFPDLDEDLFYRPISGVRLWAVCKHIDMKNHDRSNYHSETERLPLPQNGLTALTVELPELPEGMARVCIYGLQVYVEGLPSKDRRMNGCRWRG